MTLRIDNLTREVEKAKLRQKIMMNSVDQQRDILLAVAEHVGVEINLPSRAKIDWCSTKVRKDMYTIKTTYINEWCPNGKCNADGL